MTAVNKTSVKKTSANKTAAGTFYGVGVGPGDPELLTLKALRIIQQCALITYLRSDRSDSATQNKTQGMARDIASAAVASATHPEQKEYAITMPMCETRAVANAVYDDAALAIANHLEHGQDVVFLCQGDPFFFGSFAYLYERLNGRYPIEIVPGVTSINASSALSGKPLSLQAENLAIISGRRCAQDILHTLSHFDNVAIMKPGRRRAELLQLIAQAGRTQDSCYIEYAGHKNQKIVYDIASLNAQPGPYFSLFLINRARIPFPKNYKNSTTP